MNLKPRDTAGIEYRIGDEALRLLAALAAREVEGVASQVEDSELGILARRRLVGSVELPEREAGAAPKVTIAVRYGRSIPEVARQVQRRVAGALREQAGVEVERVDVHVAEVVA
ncbi:Asp23/Gls24 family envelope stress response protein [Rubrobacter taiwanensis]|uniref:Asp23/Gls24 family envelope stress response protein n=1 Tax=Rubrobacter taiwanensis TaxID=185139 RepID=A0A4R1BJ10_9ACTN|nr:Asp23/Gls24 family envelope stress response protein [Rubrobacter taiwanensis]TCJ17264.1 Asp23/Gls24 family envelope stress response protein [Rubrobacter taiwanensis]